MIHIGNDDSDTAGCVLVGTQANSDKNLISHSTDAYKKIYPQILAALKRGEKVKINVVSMNPNTWTMKNKKDKPRLKDGKLFKFVKEKFPDIAGKGLEI